MLPALAIVFASWDLSNGRVCHLARSADIDARFGGFQFVAFCGANDRSDELGVDLVSSVGCPGCRAAVAQRAREVGEEAGV